MIRGRIKDGQSVVDTYIVTCIYSCQVRVDFLLMVILTFEALSHATVPIFPFLFYYIIVYFLSSHSRHTTVPVGKDGGNESQMVLRVVTCRHVREHDLPYPDFILFWAINVC